MCVRRRRALFFARKKACTVDYYLRSITVHNRALEAEQVRNEHAMLEALLKEHSSLLTFLADLDADGLVTFEEFVIAVQSELPDVRNKKRRTGEGKNNKCDGFLFLFSPRLLGSLAFFPIMKSLPTDRPTA